MNATIISAHDINNTSAWRLPSAEDVDHANVVFTHPAFPWDPPSAGQACLSSVLITTALVLVVLCLHIRRKYLAFLALGPGGTPSTPLGFARVSALSLFAVRHRTEPRLSHAPPSTQYLSPMLPRRPGPRPITQGIAPHRQTTQLGPHATHHLLTTGLSHLAAHPRWSRALTLGTSCFEKHATGLLLARPPPPSVACAARSAAAAHGHTRNCAHEICHAHPSDGSLHVVLHPADADAVVARGWGEWHPLSRGGWWERFVPRTFVLVYAPRDEREVDVVLGVVEAGVRFAVERSGVV